MFNTDEPFPEYQRAVRERASESLGPLRFALNSPVRFPQSHKHLAGRDHYTSAVSRLKDLLQQYDNNTSDASFTKSKDTPPGLPHSVPFSSQTHIPNKDELTELLDNYFTVVQHLDSQVDFYKDALASLKNRTELLTQENKALYEQLKVKAIAEVLEEEQKASQKRQQPATRERMSTQHVKGNGHVRFELPDAGDSYEETQSYPPSPGGDHPGEPMLSGEGSGIHHGAHSGEIGNELFLSPKERHFVLQMEEEVDKIRELHEAKSKQLETLLYSTRDELEDYQRLVADLQSKLRNQDILLDRGGEAALCVKCGHRQAMLSPDASDTAMKTIDNLTRERDELMEMLTRQKASLTDVRKRELDAFAQVKNSCELVEQAQLEKAQAIIQVQQLKDEIKKQRDRHDRYTRESRDREVTERANMTTGLRDEIDNLTKKVQSVSDAHAAVEAQLERVTREKVAMAAELDHAKAQILAHSSDIAKIGEDAQKEITEAIMKTTRAEQEVASLKTAAQQATRLRQQERARQDTETNELRRRLEEAQTGWVDSKEECIRLAEKLDHADRKAKITAATLKNKDKARTDEIASLTQQAVHREQQLSALLEEKENRNTRTRVELEQLLESQLQVSARLQDEGRRLTQQIEELSIKSRSELRAATSVHEKTQAQLKSATAKIKNLEASLENKDKRVEKLTSKLKQTDASANKQAKQIYELLVKQNSLLKDRQALTREVEYLRQQLLQSRKIDCVTPSDTESNVSIAENQVTL